MKHAQKPARILIIEDNADIANLVRVNLKDAGFRLDHAANGESGLRLALEGSHDLIILDLMLPGIDGLEVCRRLRAQEHYTPVLMLTAKSSELDRVLGLEMGADDYLTKPFSVPELVARVKAMLRRAESYNTAAAPEPDGDLHYGSLSISARTRQVHVDETPVELTAKEFDLLWHFASQPGRVFTRSQLLDSMWGYGHDGYEHTVNSHINRLRAKIEHNPNKPRYVLTVWGIGYKFVQDAAA
jgi:DNA-binding response OmpR family regulator